MKPYMGIITLTESPVFCIDDERAPTTSASPPDLEKGTVSEVSISTFILQLHNRRVVKSREKNMKKAVYANYKR